MNKIIITSFIVDMFLGDPPRHTHPIVLIGKLISFTEKFLRNKFNVKSGEKALGVLLWVIVVGVSYFLSSFIISLSYSLSHFLGFVVSVWLLYTTLAIRNLSDEAMRIFNALKENNLKDARKFVSGIVGRDTENLSIVDVSRATVETVAENTIDGIVSPMFYFFIGGVPLAMAYKAVNTLDSMVGYKNEHYTNFGWFSAIVDDVVNFLPARIGGAFMLASAGLLGLNIRRGVKTVISDAKKHKSPNSGIPEAIVAGALGIQLGGWDLYFGVMQFRPYLGEKTRDIETRDISRVTYLSVITSIITLVAGLVLNIYLN